VRGNIELFRLGYVAEYAGGGPASEGDGQESLVNLPRLFESGSVWVGGQKIASNPPLVHWKVPQSTGWASQEAPWHQQFYPRIHPSRAPDASASTVVGMCRRR
jgi:hypothetical protein